MTMIKLTEISHEPVLISIDKIVCVVVDVAQKCSVVRVGDGTTFIRVEESLDEIADKIRGEKWDPEAKKWISYG